MSTAGCGSWTNGTGIRWNYSRHFRHVHEAWYAGGLLFSSERKSFFWTTKGTLSVAEEPPTHRRTLSGKRTSRSTSPVCVLISRKTKTSNASLGYRTLASITSPRICRYGVQSCYTQGITTFIVLAFAHPMVLSILAMMRGESLLRQMES